MNSFQEKIDENLNKNYELLSRNYQNLFDNLLKRKIEETIKKSGSFIISRDYIATGFFNDVVILDLKLKIIRIVHGGFNNNQLPMEIIKSMNNFEQLDLFSSSLVLHYLTTSDGAPVTGEWILYRELPDGLFYASTIDGVLQPLVNKYGDCGAHFTGKILKYGGKILAGFKHSGIIFPFKNFPVAFILEEKDEEFGAGIRALFDKNASHYLKTDIIKTLLVYTVKKLLQ